MTIKRLLALAEALTPHAYSEDIMLLWLSQCESSILTDIFLVAPEETKEYSAADETTLLVPHPYDKLYLPYLQAQIAHANQEYDLYANYLALYEAYRDEYAQYIVRGADPGSGDAVRRGYYLSAYGIAVAHGYAGTEEEWLASLKGAAGAPGEPGMSAYEEARKQGYEGTEAEWLASLKGKNGLSAYEVALEQGFEGNKEDWIHSLHGADGVSRSEVIARATDGVSYAANVANFVPEIGTEIVLLPQSANASAPTLSINGGEAYPLCLRPGWNITGDDRNPQLTLPIPEGILLRGAEYVFRFDGYSWILQSYVDRPASGEAYKDVTGEYLGSSDYRDQPEGFLRSLGTGKWLINDGKALYRMEIFALDGQEWRIEQTWTDNGIYTMRMVNKGREIVNFDSANEELVVNGNVIAPSGNNSSGDKPSSDGTCDIPVGAVSPLDIQGVTWLNWFDYEEHLNNYEANKYINPKNGVISDLNGWYVFPKIFLTGGKTYTMSGSLRYCVMYNAADDSYIQTISNNASSKNPVTFEVDEAYSEVYLRFCDNSVQNSAYLSDKFMIVEGDTIPDGFMPHEAVIPWLSIADKTINGAQLGDASVDGNKLKDGDVDGKKLKSGSVPADKLAPFCGSTNLYNSTLADKSLWHSVNGTGNSSLTDYFASPLIPVAPGKTYYLYAVHEAATKASTYSIVTPYAAYEVSANGVYSKITLETDATSGKAIIYNSSENAKFLAFNGRVGNIGEYVVSEKFHAYCPPYAAQLANVQNVVQGHYAGGTLVALGDSITRGCSNGETLEDGTVLANGGQIPKPYANYAAELLGMYCKNFGVDGATVKTVLARINSTDYMAGLKAQPDIITVKIGTNDMAQVTLGTIDDVYDSANATYYSGLKEIARLLSEGFPESAIVFITPLRANDNARSYVKAMEEVAALFDLPCMQMHKVLRYMQQDSNGSYYINNYYNGLHPNQAAHLRMGRALAGFLQTV